MLVEDVCEKFSDFVDRVNESDSVEKVLSVMAEHKQTRTVFVVDEKGFLKGAITIHELFKFFFDELKPKLFVFSKEKRNFTAKDIMRNVIFVSLNDDLNTALRAAVASNLQDLPVCVDGKIVAQLDCFELLFNFTKK
ncbi:MAG: CBS domain-containing protein [Candidatus Diapherotrites archaeon]|nr:CBS domain-containing protein [Candidatus Diapherotrites archaeon]